MINKSLLALNTLVSQLNKGVCAAFFYTTLSLLSKCSTQY